MESLERFFYLKGYEADLAMLKQLSVARLVDSLTMALPFDAAAEKQMLLETVEPEQRLANFIALIDGDFDVPDSVTRH
jgi:Lon protease-like protein